jgi:hypothetical protein
MDDIANIIRAKNFEVPDDIPFIKAFVKDRLGAECSVTKVSKGFVIKVKGASLAGALRMQLPDLKKNLKEDCRIQIRIS